MSRLHLVHSLSIFCSSVKTNINNLDQEPDQDDYHVHDPELNQVIDPDSDLDSVLYLVLEEDILLIVV